MITILHDYTLDDVSGAVTVLARHETLKASFDPTRPRRACVPEENIISMVTIRKA